MAEIAEKTTLTGPELQDLAWRRYAAQDLIERTLERIVREQPDRLRNGYEAYGVLLEAADRLWTEVCRRNTDWERMRIDAASVAAVAMRFLIDLCGDGEMGWKERDWTEKEKP